MVVGFYGEIELFPENYDDLIIKIKSIMRRTIEKGADTFVFYDGRYIDRIMRELSPAQVSVQMITTFKEIVPREVSVMFLAHKAWIHEYCDYVVCIQAEKPVSQRTLWLNCDTLEEEWLP